MSQSSSIEERASIGIGLELFRSVMTIVDLEVLQGFYFIPVEFHMILATSEERDHAPPMGCVGVYEEAVMVGLHFLLHPFEKRVIDRFSLSLA